MDKSMYNKIEEYMLSCMKDGAHDCQHIYRVLYHALDIARDYDVDKNVLIAAALLHDIGREAQFQNPQMDHATVGADMAYDFLIKLGWADDKAQHVKACIATHRFRTGTPPASMEAKILYDSDKLDATGLLGIARTIAYKGIVAQPLYNVDNEGFVLLEDDDNNPSFFQEYHFKLKKVYDMFYTDQARSIAESRRSAAESFYNSLYNEVITTHNTGVGLLKNDFEDQNI
ncbi:MAG: HD domain-containing protein [Ruminiclostridium sp.]|nr:HD domain-containing protein [Ruminiclostridium sp.]